MLFSRNKYGRAQVSFLMSLLKFEISEKKAIIITTTFFIDITLEIFKGLGNIFFQKMRGTLMVLSKTFKKYLLVSERTILKRIVKEVLVFFICFNFSSFYFFSNCDKKLVGTIT